MTDPVVVMDEAKSRRNGGAWSKKIKGGGVILACVVLIIVVAIVITVVTKHKKEDSDNAKAGFNKDFSITWAKNHTRVSKHGKRLELILDSESGMQSHFEVDPLLLAILCAPF